jgi:hypothetical protein
MAITAALTLTSAADDLLTDALSLSTKASLTTAGTSTAISQTTGLARRTTAVVGSTALIDTEVLYRADDYTANGANKIYIKNTSTNAAQYITVYMTGDRGGETHTYTSGLIELGRLYGGTNGDWAFFPWNATSGTKEAFTVTFANTWAAGDTFAFDGQTVIAAGSGLNEMASAVNDVQYPNWTTSVSSAVVTFTARTSRADLEIDTSEAVSTTAGDGTGAVATTVEGKKSASDIYIKPSVETGITIEHMLFYQ